MAPSAVLATTASEISPALAVGKTFANYKEQAAGAKTYNKRLEEEGDAERPRANVKPCSGPCDRGGLTAFSSILITFLHGTQTRSIPR